MVNKHRLDPVDAFELYYSLGASRSLAKLHQSLLQSAPVGQKPPSLRTLKEWSRKNNWIDRCMLKEIAIADLADKKGIRSAIELKSYLLSLVQSRVETAFEKGKPKFPVEEYRDLHDSIKLILTLIGEAPPSEAEHSVAIKIIEVHEQKRED